MPLQTPLLAVIPAFLIAAAVLAALCRPWRPGDVPRPPWAGALALAAAFVVADRLIWKNWPGLWNAEEQRRLWLVALGAGAVSFVDWAWRGRVSGSFLPWIAGAVLMLPLVWSDATRTGAYPIFAFWWLLYAGAFALLWSELSATVKVAAGVRVPLTLCLAAAGAFLTIAQSYSLSIGLMAASVSGATGALVALAVWRPALPATGGALPVFCALLVGLFVAALYNKVGIQLSCFVLTVLSGATSCLGHREPLRRLRPWQATLACALLTIVLAIASLKLTPKGFDFSEGGGP